MLPVKNEACIVEWLYNVTRLLSIIFVSDGTIKERGMLNT